MVLGDGFFAFFVEKEVAVFADAFFEGVASNAFEFGVDVNCFVFLVTNPEAFFHGICQIGGSDCLFEGFLVRICHCFALTLEFNTCNILPYVLRMSRMKYECGSSIQSGWCKSPR